MAKGYEASTELLSELSKHAVGKISVSRELEPLLANADVLYTDCWPRETDAFTPYQITTKYLAI